MRAALIGTSAVYALAAASVTNCCVAYSMVLGFHTGIEIKVLQSTLDFAAAAATPDYAMALAYVGAVVVIVHLVDLVTSTLWTKESRERWLRS